MDSDSRPADQKARHQGLQAAAGGRQSGGGLSGQAAGGRRRLAAVHGGGAENRLQRLGLRRDTKRRPRMADGRGCPHGQDFCELNSMSNDMPHAGMAQPPRSGVNPFAEEINPYAAPRHEGYAPPVGPTDMSPFAGLW